jgi:hypothetical protein
MTDQIPAVDAQVKAVAAQLDFPVTLGADMGGTFVLQIDLGTRGGTDDPNDRAGIDPTDETTGDGEAPLWWLDIEGGTRTLISDYDITTDPAVVARWISQHARSEGSPAASRSL